MKKTLFASSLLLLTTPLFAAPITISNPNLDAQMLSDGAFTHDVQGWAVINGYAGIYNPPESIMVGEGGVGMHENALYLIGDSLVTQSLNTNLESNTDYSLSFDVGDRLDTPFPNYIVKITVGGHTIFSAVNPLIPNGGEFSNVNLSFSTGTSAYAGQPMVLEIEAKSNGQVLLDNFSLDGVAGNGNFTSQFGEWNHTTLGGTQYTINTTYQAETDGFMTFRNSGNCQGNTYDFRIGDDTSLPGYITRVDHIGSMMAPVKAGQYWQIHRVRNVSSCNLFIGFLPLNP